jgi:hypothetical protein
MGHPECFELDRGYTGVYGFPLLQNRETWGTRDLGCGFAGHDLRELGAHDILG